MTTASSLLDELLAQEQQKSLVRLMKAQPPPHRAAQELEARRQMTHAPPLPDIGPAFTQAFLTGLVADPLEFFWQAPIIRWPEVGPSPLSETPIQDYMRAQGILTEQGVPTDRASEAAAFAGRLGGGILGGGVTPAAVVRGGAKVARAVGESAGATRAPWLAQRGAIGPPRVPPPTAQTQATPQSRIRAAYERLKSAAPGSAEREAAGAEYVAAREEMVAAFTGRAQAPTRTAAERAQQAEWEKELNQLQREQEQALGPPAHRDPQIAAALNVIRQSYPQQPPRVRPPELSPENLARQQEEMIQTLERLKEARRYLDEPIEQQELVASLSPGNQAIMRNLDPASPAWWDEFRALQASEQAAPAPVQTATIFGPEQPTAIDLRQVRPDYYRWHNSATGEAVGAGGGTPEEAISRARARWQSFQQGPGPAPAQPAAQLPRATVRTPMGGRMDLELVRESDGQYRWYDAGHGTNIAGSTPEEAIERGRATWTTNNRTFTLGEAAQAPSAAQARAEEQAPAPAKRAKRGARFGTPAQQAKVETLFKGIAERPESFQFGGAPTSPHIDDIVAHYSTDNAPLEVRTDSFGDIRITNEKTGGYISIVDAESDTPHISSPKAESAGIEEGGGKNMYQAAFSWATNNGKEIIPDYAISDINRLRKVENAISSYLRHGTEGYVDLSNATLARGLREMLVETKNKVFGLRSDLEMAARFDGEKFVSPSGGVLDNKSLKALIANNDPHFRMGIGVTTLKRALMTKWAMSATRREIAEAAKKFGDQVLYALAGLAIGGRPSKQEEERL